MQFDDPRVLHAAEALDCAFYPLRKRLDVAIEFLLSGGVEIPVVGQTVLRRSKKGMKGQSQTRKVTEIEVSYQE